MVLPSLLMPMELPNDSSPSDPAGAVSFSYRLPSFVLYPYNENEQPIAAHHRLRIHLCQQWPHRSQIL
jgi:hypothetical protein